MLKTHKFGLKVLIYFGPLLLLWLWLTFGYTHRYAVTTQFSLRNHQATPGIAFGEAAMLTGAGSAQQDLHLIREYILSPNLLTHLENQLSLRAVYSSSEILPPQRLEKNISFEAFLEHYRSLINISIDPGSGIVTMQIEGYTREQTLAQSNYTLKAAEAYINEVSKKIAERQAASAHEHLETAREERAQKNRRLLAFQSQNATLLPSRDSASALSIIGSLEAQLAAERARLVGQSGLLAANSSIMIESRTKVQALEGQIAAERSRLFSESPSESLAFHQVLASFQLIQTDLELATKSYSEALAALQRAQIAAAENLKALVVISSAIMPEKTKYPRVWVWMLIASIAHLFIAPHISNLVYNDRRKTK